MGHSENWFVDDTPYHSEEWYVDRYDHKYSGQEATREFVRIVKLHIRELEQVLQDQLDNHEDRLSIVEQRLDDVTGASEGITLEQFVNETIERLNSLESDVTLIFERLDNFAETSEGESLTIEQVIQQIINSIADIEDRLNSITVGSETMTLQEFAEYILERIGELELDIDELLERVGLLEDTAVQGIEYNGVIYRPIQTSEGNIVFLDAIAGDIYTLQQLLASESSERETVDEELRLLIESLGSESISGLDALWAALHAETDAREDADDDLDGRITYLENNAVEGVKYIDDYWYPVQSSEGNIVDLSLIRSDIWDDVLAELGRIIQISYEVVDVLPPEGELGVIYLIKIESSESSEEDNVYEEYIYVGEGSEAHFELIGSTRVDLSDIEDINNALEQMGSELEDLREEIEGGVLHGVKVNGVELVKDAEGKVNIIMPDVDMSNVNIGPAIVGAGGSTLTTIINNINNAIEQESSERESADDALQAQIDALNNPTTGAIKDVKVHNVSLTKTNNSVNIPLVSTSADGVAPQVSNSADFDEDDLVLSYSSSDGYGVAWRKINFYELP